MNSILSLLSGPVIYAFLCFACPCVIGFIIFKFWKNRQPLGSTGHQVPPSLPNSSEPVFQIARSGKMLGTFPQSYVALCLKSSNRKILLTDFYWTAGMVAWQKVSAKNDWDVIPVKVTNSPPRVINGNSSEALTGVISINGTILSFTIQESAGLIVGDDSIRYSFAAKSWKVTLPPSPGLRVSFVSKNNEAFDIYPIAQPSAQQSAGKFQRSANKKVIGGVCSGLAAHWKMDPTMVRVVVAAVSLFGSLAVVGLVVPVIYLGLWIFAPEGPTE